jgi:glutamyl-tRNA synthetase/glutamyl-Q tRNA(Asp) synthetase
VKPESPVETGVQLNALTARLPARPRTRFAPSPTGHLHLGHAVNAIYVWGVARALDGRVVLRIEDHDRQRARTEFEASILEDLDWLGLEGDLQPAPPTVSPGHGFGARAVRQRDRHAVYERALERLSSQGLVYACECSRRQIEEAGGAGDELRYPGTCRSRGLPLEGRPLRVRLPEDEVVFADALVGSQHQVPARQCGDLLLRDRVGQWTYQFAVTVDDADQEIDLVIRGADLLPSTGRQILLARLLGREQPPLFLHHPLIVGADGAKLSKSNGDAGIRELRAAGATSAEVLGRAAARVGLIARERPLPARDLGGLFAS